MLKSLLYTVNSPNLYDTLSYVMWPLTVYHASYMKVSALPSPALTNETSSLHASHTVSLSTDRVELSPGVSNMARGYLHFTLQLNGVM